jgi:hypothetical protein
MILMTRQNDGTGTGTLATCSLAFRFSDEILFISEMIWHIDPVLLFWPLVHANIKSCQLPMSSLASCSPSLHWVLDSACTFPFTFNSPIRYLLHFFFSPRSFILDFATTLRLFVLTTEHTEPLHRLLN